jgi:hypothetical protein
MNSCCGSRKKDITVIIQLLAVGPEGDKQMPFFLDGPPPIQQGTSFQGADRCAGMAW